MSQLTLADLFENHYCRTQLVAASENTLADYRIQLRHVERSFRARVADRPPTVDDLSDALIGDCMRDRIAAKCSTPTANKLYRVAVALWRYAYRQRLVDTLPRSLRRLKEPDTKPTCWSVEEFNALLAAAATDAGLRDTPGKVGQADAGIWWPSLILLIYSTGLRIDAVMRLRSDWLELPQARLFVAAAVQKQKADQYFDLLPQAVDVLARLDHRRNATVFGDWPFDKQQNQWPSLNYHFRKILHRAGLAAGRRDLWHKLRRTFATFAAREAGEAVAQALLGHSSINVTRRYIDQTKLQRPRASDLLPPPVMPEGLKVLWPDAGAG